MAPPFDLLPRLLSGLLVTLQIFLGGALLAIACALLAGLSRISRDPILRFLSLIYIEMFRGTSVLVQLFWFYFALPMLLGISLPAMTVGIAVLGLNIGAYGAEVVRSAILSVPKTQHHAAIALNMTRWQRMRFIIFPQALPLILPPMGNLLIELLKTTALLSMITVTEMTRVAMYLRDETLRTTAIFGWLLVIYFLLSLLITASTRHLERRLSHGTDPGGRA